MARTITKSKIEKYKKITSTALEIIKKNISPRKQKQAKEIISMAENYLSDAKFFEKKNDYINAFAALNYAHGWIDAGVRLKIFKVKDRNLFTLP